MTCLRRGLGSRLSTVLTKLDWILREGFSQYNGNTVSITSIYTNIIDDVKPDMLEDIYYFNTQLVELVALFNNMLTLQFKGPVIISCYSVVNHNSNEILRTSQSKRQTKLIKIYQSRHTAMT